MAYRAAALLALSSMASIANANPMWHPSSSSTSSAYLPFPTQVPSSKNLLLSNGFPTPDKNALAAINQAAHGTLSNAPPANMTFTPDSLTNFQLVAFNEFFEVAFFTSLLTNVTTHVPGFEIPAHLNETFILDTLIAVQAQEQLHALNANSKLPTPLNPCAYKFPTTTFDDAIALAQTFTDVVLGTLQDVSNTFVQNGNGAAGVVGSVASTIGQEGEQNGFYRSILAEPPSAQPFLTASARNFAFSDLNQNFVVPASCDISSINLKVFGALTLETSEIGSADQTIAFSFAAAEYEGDFRDLQFVLVSGQNVPIVQNLRNVSRDGDRISFEAEFLQQTDLLFGLTIGAVVKRGGDLATVHGVADAALFGPALIEVA